MAKALPRLYRLIRNPTFQALAPVVVYIVVTCVITLLIHYSYRTAAFDLGIFAQALQSTLNGDLLYSTPAGMSQLGYHFQPILFLLVPIYWLVPYAETLLVVQSIALGASGYLVYRLARIQGLSHSTALFVEVLFLLSPLLLGVNFFDFHPVALAVPTLLIMLIGLLRRRWKLFALGLLLSLMTKQDVILALAVFGLVMLVAHYVREKKLDRVYLVLFASAMATFGIAIVVAKAVSGLNVPPMLMYGSLRYTYINEPFGQMILGALGSFFSSSSMFLLLAYFLPLAFLPLLSPLWAVPALFILALSMFSTKVEQHALTQYPAAAIPFLFMALISTLVWMGGEGRAKLFLRRAWKFLPVVMIVATLLINFTPGVTFRKAALPGEHARAISRVIALIPDGVTVTAPNHIFPHLYQRTDAYIFLWWEHGAPNRIYGDFGVPNRETDYVVVDWQRQDPNPLFDQWQEKYELIVEMDGVSLYKLK